ncbi:hypothetical protein OTK50_15380 [Bacillus sp. NEAU-CP5]|uniref:hypothetical protein n=1 Tax=Bacillus TaxID=1386 RepID=UPI00225417B4|nr:MULTISPECIES: hypothetical protein [Bacillus]MCX3306573.1 hypothetical protein [Bacillus velezensis]MCX8441173.1 hypothetical protein [Bacillus sp. NEAU-CP5]WOH97265.1 hypothetical protein R0744_19015 [Bacillus amyloliquefaciens]WOI49663.1 hypothetical protein R0833_17290 [Bacillus amyloliquefaciens]WOI65475.1 hypothetical protein R0887_17805 [Bacillus amyloliquefaciens]
MSDFQDGSTLVETISGKWFKFANGKSGTMLIDLPNKIILSVHVSSQMIGIYIPDENNVYQLAGDLSFQNNDGQTKMHLFSTALKQIQLDNKGGTIENTFHDITSFFAELDISRKDDWRNRQKMDELS